METVIRRVVVEMTRQGHEAKLFLIGGSQHEEWLAGLTHRSIGRPTDRRWHRHLKYATLFPASVLSFSPDVLICADGAALRLAWLIRRPFLSATPIGSWFHQLVSKSHDRSLRLADFHLCINGANHAHVIDNADFRQRNSYLVYNPVETETKEPLIARPAEQAHFMYVGRLIYDGPKSVREFICALGDVPGNWVASIVGDGEDRERLLALAKDLSIDDRITWAGWQDRPWESVAPVSALVLTSESEGFPTVLTEAMSRGVTCVSSDCQGVLDIMQDGVNGWVYPVGNTSALSGILAEIVSGERQLPDAAAVRASVSRFASGCVVRSITNACEAEVVRRGGAPMRAIGANPR
jgi:UDP-D-galactose:(glucosyl)LPS alpha-1,6-D-galactosyltransferase